MLEAAEGTFFPVVFFDGERELQMGNIRVSPMEVYMTFQNNISQKLGISTDEISIFLVDLKNRCKSPITAISNFAQICRERDCLFLAVLKRQKPSSIVVPPPLHTPQFHYVPHNVPLLPYPVVNQQFLQELAMAQHFLNPPYPLLHTNSNVGFPGVEPVRIMENPVSKFCEECAIAEKNEKVAEFHHCVNDIPVKESRRSTFGPIGPV